MVWWFLLGFPIVPSFKSRSVDMSLSCLNCVFRHHLLFVFFCVHGSPWWWGTAMLETQNMLLVKVAQHRRPHGNAVTPDWGTWLRGFLGHCEWRHDSVSEIKRSMESGLPYCFLVAQVIVSAVTTPTTSSHAFWKWASPNCAKATRGKLVHHLYKISHRNGRAKHSNRQTVSFGNIISWVLLRLSSECY